MCYYASPPLVYKTCIKNTSFRFFDAMIFYVGLIYHLNPCVALDPIHLPIHFFFLLISFHFQERQTPRLVPPPKPLIKSCPVTRLVDQSFRCQNDAPVPVSFSENSHCKK